MSISRTDLATVRRVKIPSLEISEFPQKNLKLRHILKSEQIIEVRVAPIEEVRNKIKCIQINLGDNNSILVNREKEETLFTNVNYELKATFFQNASA